MDRYTQNYPDKLKNYKFVQPGSKPYDYDADASQPMDNQNWKNLSTQHDI